MISKIDSFFRRNKTIGHKILDLYNHFKVFYGKEISFEEFEQALIQSHKRIIIQIKQKCMEYIKINGSDSYQKFIKEVEYISERLWKQFLYLDQEEISIKKENKTVSTKKIKSDYEKINQTAIINSNDLSLFNDPESDTKEKFHKLLPVQWAYMSFSDRVEFVKKIQHKNFYNYVLEQDKKLKNYFLRFKLTATGVKIYVTIFSIPSDSYSEESKILLKTFVTALNLSGRARLQFVQCTDPDIIEIREVR